MLAPLLVSLIMLGPAYSPAPSKDAGEADDEGQLESMYALLSLRLGVGPAFHPRIAPDKGLAIDVRFGSVFVIPPIFAVWPELGGAVEVRDGFERVAGTVDLNFGLPAFLYYGVGFEGGLEGRARLLGFRHGLDLRFFQVFGIAVMHHVTHTPVRDLQHEVRLMFSFDVLALVPLSGSKGTIFEVGQRRIGG